MELAFRPMDEESACAVLQWRYSPPFDVYDIAPLAADALATFLDHRNAYYRLHGRSGSLEAFCCLGADARVPGGDYAAEALDIGAGLRPDLTGKGQGSEYINAILEFAVAKYQPHACRVTSAAFNHRAQRVWLKAGFEQTQRFQRVPGAPAFVALVRRSVMPRQIV
jgi:ribosomal-protein-alanine N-acetyltransferase